jgi:hypothetical protein
MKAKISGKLEELIPPFFLYLSNDFSISQRKTMEFLRDEKSDLKTAQTSGQQLGGLLAFGD